MSKPPIYQLMYDLLTDGKPHSVTELHSYCGPSSRGVVRFHIRRIRDTMINKEEEEVLCTLVNCSVHYQLVRKYRHPTETRSFSS